MQPGIEIPLVWKIGLTLLIVASVPISLLVIKLTKSKSRKKLR